MDSENQSEADSALLVYKSFEKIALDVLNHNRSDERFHRQYNQLLQLENSLSVSQAAEIAGEIRYNLLLYHNGNNGL